MDNLGQVERTVRAKLAELRYDLDFSDSPILRRIGLPENVRLEDLPHSPTFNEFRAALVVHNYFYSQASYGQSAPPERFLPCNGQEATLELVTSDVLSWVANQVCTLPPSRLRAYYCDFLLQFKTRLRGLAERIPAVIEVAEQAIEGYLEFAEKEVNTYGVCNDAVCRAAKLCKMFKRYGQGERVVSLAFKAVSRLSSGDVSNPYLIIPIGCIICDAGFTVPPDFQKLIQQALEKIVEEGDERYADNSSVWFKALSPCLGVTKEEIERLNKKWVDGKIEYVRHVETENSALAALGHLENAMKFASDKVGGYRLGEMKEIQKRLHSDTRKEMKEYFVPVQGVEKWLQDAETVFIGLGSPKERLQTLLSVPSQDRLRDEARSDASCARYFAKKLIIGPQHQVIPAGEDRLGKFVTDGMLCSMEVKVLLITHIRGKFADKGWPSLRDQCEIMEGSPLLESGYREQAKRGLSYYHDSDWMGAILFIVPLIEAMIRRLTERLGGVTTSRSSKGRMTNKSLDELLSEGSDTLDRSGSFDRDLKRSLQFILVDETGLNIRNNALHALFEEKHFNSFNATLVWCCFWWLALLPEQGPRQEEQGE